MSENRTGKCIKYTIVEILLVMSVILLELQGNNLNEGWIDRISDRLIGF